VNKEAGLGRSVYLPALRFDGALPEPGGYGQIGSRFWKRPANWEQFVAAIRWAARDELPVRIGGPGFLAANLVSQLEKRRWMLHLVNYHARTGKPTGAIEVTCRLPAPAKEVRLYSPDTERSPAIPAKTEGTTVTFTLPPVTVYSIAAVSW